MPLSDHGRNYILGNVPYAGAAITAFIKKNFGAMVKPEHLPFVIENFGSNSMIVKYIRNISPDVLCFTCYLWNVERSIDVAGEVKRYLRDVKIFMGGPETRHGSWALSKKRECVDYFISGEGEWFFTMLLGGKNPDGYVHMHNGNFLLVQPESELIDAERIVEPLTSGYIHAMADDSVFLEMTRGCPYRCTYCFYSKNCSKVREIPFRVLLKALEKNTLSIKEIYILSPTFNITGEFKKKLETIAAVNTGVRLHTEMRTGGIDRTIAGLIYKAGFRSLEVGLQTLSEDALKRIGRHGDTSKELKGMKELKNAGIDLKIGIIPGLPGDTAGGFMDTVKKLIRLGFEENIELYPLCILPGTKIRDEGDLDGVLYQKKPPYYFLEGWGFSFDDMKKIISDTEFSTGYTHTIKALPDFITITEGILNGGIKCNGDAPSSWDGERYRELIQTAVFNFYITLSSTEHLAERLDRLFETIPWNHQLYNIILYTDHSIDEKKLYDLLIKIDRDSLLRRMNIFDDWKEGLGVNFYQVMENVQAYNQARDEYDIITPVFRVTRENSSSLAGNDGTNMENIVIGKGTLGTVMGLLLEWSATGDVLIGFETEEEQEAFYRETRQEYIKWPFEIRTTVFH